MSHDERLRTRFGTAAVNPPPPPWRRPAGAPRTLAVGGLLGVGFAAHPEHDSDLVLVASHQGRGVYDAATGERLARDRDPDYGDLTDPDLACRGIGPLAGTRVPLCGLFGGGLHRVTADGWALDVASPDWPTQRVVLSTPSHDPYQQPDRGGWQVIHDEITCELRAVGFSPTGTTLIIASSCAIDLFIRP